MPRAMWKGAISFGLVTIPVAVYPATEEKTLRFNQLHDEDGGAIRYKRVCEKDGEEVTFEHIVKGYEVEKDRYVVGEDDVAVLLDLVALDDVLEGDLFAILLADALVADGPAVLVVELVETERLLLGRRVDGDRDRHEAEADGPLPHGTRHDRLPPAPQVICLRERPSYRSPRTWTVTPSRWAAEMAGASAAAP